jgi:hypothetical protein
MAASVAVGFQLTANAAGMSQGINAGVVELQKLGLAAKQTAGDVRVLTGLQLGTAFVSAVRSVARSFTQFTAGASASIDSTNKLSRALGISFGELQRLQLAADLSGASSEQLANAFTRAQVTITKASRGGREATAALRSLGLSIGELSTLSASQQFERIATAIAGIDNPAQRAAAAVAIFGRSGAQLLPTFQELASNLQRAEGFFGGFRSQLTSDDAAQVEAINDAFTEVQKAVQQTAGLILSRLSPALLSGAATVRTFIQNLNIDEVASRAASALEQFARGGQLLAQVVSVGLQRPLLAVGSALAFINRQAIFNGITGLARSFSTAAAAAGSYTVSMRLAAGANAVFAASIRGIVAATGLGLVIVGLGLAGEAAINYATKTDEAGDAIDKKLRNVQQSIQAQQDAFRAAATAAQNFGAKVQAAVKVPQLSIGDIAQDSINQAQSAIAGLAKELGGTVNLPRELVSQFNQVQRLAEQANGDLANQRFLLGQLVQESNRFVAAIEARTRKQREDAQAATDAAEAIRRASEDARRRTQELAFDGLGGGEQSRIKLAQDLLAIDRERVAAEEALSAARRTNDQAGIVAARQRLNLVGQAANVAREQDRQRQLQALGIDNNLLKPAETIATQFEALRKATRDGLLKRGEIENAIANIAKEGIEQRKEIARELARPSTQALRIADIRSSEGIGQFFAANREDPALDQRREQIARLTEIAREIRALRAIPVEIKG